MKTRLLGAVLVVSIGVNAYLLLRSAPSSASASVARPAASAAGGAPLDEPRTQDAHLPAPSVLPPPRIAAPSPPTAGGLRCEDRLTLAQGQLRLVEAELDRYLPPKERFARGEPDPDSEARLRPELARILTEQAGVASWSLSCRSRICKVELQTERSERSRWMQDLQSDPALRRWQNALTFTSDTLAMNAGAASPKGARDVYIGVRAEADEVGPRLAETAAAFKASGALRECTGSYVERGTFGLVMLDAGVAPRFRFGGTLAATRAGDCLSERFRAAFAWTDATAVASSYRQGVSLTSPPPGTEP